MTLIQGELANQLHFKHWECDGTARAVVLIAHGLAEHSGRYQWFASQLNSMSVDVAALDHLGHGKSPGARCVVDRFGDYLEGVDALFKEVGAAATVPVYLFGHSMGGLIAAHSALRHPQRYAGLILSGPAVIAPDPPPALQRWVLRLVSALFPAAGVLALDGTAISTDQAVVDAYFADPLVYNGKISARLACELFDAMTALQSRAGEFVLPLLLMHATADRLTAPAGSDLIFECAASDDKTIKRYQGLFHEILNEPQRDSVFADLRHWLDTRLT
ncbi:MAG: lysophospholipase [Pseudomonadota bacterium]